MNRSRFYQHSTEQIDAPCASCKKDESESNMTLMYYFHFGHSAAENPAACLTKFKRFKQAKTLRTVQEFLYIIY